MGLIGSYSPPTNRLVGPLAAANVRKNFVRRKYLQLLFFIII